MCTPSFLNTGIVFILQFVNVSEVVESDSREMMSFSTLFIPVVSHTVII